MNQTEESKRNKKRAYLIYTGLFALVSLFIVLYLLINTASDGMNQHYRAMLYYSKYLKSIISGLIHEHQLTMPHWNFAIGEGSDIISTLHSDAVGDPLTFLSVLIPEKYLPEYYMFNTFIRVYLAGIFFISLCFYLGKENTLAILAGALTYSYCFWSLESITHHVYFLTPLMILPLMILGLEKIINKDEPFTFVIAVFWGSVSWLYFFYMEAAATAIYGVIRLLTKYRGDIKTILMKLLVILAYAILGIGMSAIVLFPMLRAYMGDKRMGIENVVSLLYPPFFYERLLTVFLSNDSAYDLCMGFAAPTLLALALSIRKIRKNSCLALVNIVTFICVCLPFCGKVLNGFSFVSQRWSFAIALPVAYTLVEEWDDIRDNRKFLSIVFVLVLGLAGYSAWSRNERVFVPLTICLIFLAVACSKMDKKVFDGELRQWLMILLILVNILYIEQYSFSPRGGGVINDVLSIQRAHELPGATEAAVIKDYLKDKDDGFFRYTGNRLTNNAAMTLDTNSTAFYWSITNSSDQQFRLKLGLLDFICWQINGYDNRAELESLANVRYYIAKKDYDGILPYGFEFNGESGDYNIYINRFAMPFGYTYDKAISYEYFDSLDMLSRQNAMMETIVIEEENTNGLSDLAVKEIPYTISCGEGISVKDNKIFVNKENAEIKLHFDSPEIGELYVELSGLEYEDIYHIIEDDHTGSTITVETSEGVTNYFSYLTKSHHYYYGKSDYLGYFGNDVKTDEVTMSFSLIGEYTFDRLKVLVESLDKYGDQVASLSEEHLENVTFLANEVKGTISLSHEKYLLLSVPYSKGWRAYVDGMEAEVLEANQHYIGLKLDSGDHEIVLRYSSPGLKTGAIVTLVSFVALGGLIFFKNRKKR